MDAVYLFKNAGVGFVDKNLPFPEYLLYVYLCVADDKITIQGAGGNTVLNCKHVE